jgi:hypothetical protein
MPLEQRLDRHLEREQRRLRARVRQARDKRPHESGATQFDPPSNAPSGQSGMGRKHFAEAQPLGPIALTVATTIIARGESAGSANIQVVARLSPRVDRSLP